jgi:tetratricopeptide (TPR) repeat protein
MNPTPLSRYAQRLADVDRYVYAGRTDEAFAIIEETKRVFDTPPMSYAVSYGNIEIYRALDQPDSMEAAIKGLELYIQAMGMEAMRPEVDQARARILELRGDVAGAASVLEQVVAANPSLAGAHRRLGRCYRELGRSDEARKELERSLALYPSHPQTHVELALLFHATGDARQAREHLDRALAVWEHADPTYRDAARARELADQWDAATSM